MEADTNDPFKLLKMACKALNDYDKKQPEIVPCDIKLQEAPDAQEPETAKNILSPSFNSCIWQPWDFQHNLHKMTDTVAEAQKLTAMLIR
jgi:hypothetical protein